MTELQRIEVSRKEIDNQLTVLVELALLGYSDVYFYNPSDRYGVQDFLGNSENAHESYEYFGHKIDRQLYDDYRQKMLVSDDERLRISHAFHDASQNDTLASTHDRLRIKLKKFVDSLYDYIQQIVVNPDIYKYKPPTEIRIAYNPLTEFRLYAYYVFYNWCLHNLTPVSMSSSRTAYEYRMFALGIMYYAHCTSDVLGLRNGGRKLAPLEFLLHLSAYSSKFHASFPYDDDIIPTERYESTESYQKAQMRRESYNHLRGQYIMYQTDSGAEKQETEIQKNFRTSIGPRVKEVFVDPFLRGDSGAFAIWNQYEGFSYTRFGRRKSKRSSPTKPRRRSNNKKHV
jgi:hypothetical protein